MTALRDFFQEDFVFFAYGTEKCHANDFELTKTGEHHSSKSIQEIYIIIDLECHFDVLNDDDATHTLAYIYIYIYMYIYIYVYIYILYIYIYYIYIYYIYYIYIYDIYEQVHTSKCIRNCINNYLYLIYFILDKY